MDDSTTEVFYHLRDQHGNPHVTVCLRRVRGYVSRGVAICSEKDSFSYKIGRIIASGRARKAFFASRPVKRFNKNGSGLSKPCRILAISGGAYITDKAHFSPPLTQFENRILTSAERLPNTDEVYEMAHLENEEFSREAMTA